MEYMATLRCINVRGLPPIAAVCWRFHGCGWPANAHRVRTFIQ